MTQFTYYRWRKEFGGLKSDQVKRLKELERENEQLRKAVSDLTLEKLILREATPAKLVIPARRRRCVDHVRQKFSASGRVLGQHRSTQRKLPCGRADGDAQTAEIVALAAQCGCYGYRRITALLRDVGWVVNAKRVERIWRRERLKVPQKQPRRGRLWFNDGACIRLRPERANHVSSYDFVESRTHDERKFRMLNLIDEFTRECLATRVDRKLRSSDVIDVLSDQFILRGVPDHIRSDNGPEFVTGAVGDWIPAVGAKTDYIEPGSPWENGYCESFNARLRGRVARRRNLLQPCRGEDHHRVLAPPLQHEAPTLIAGLSAASSRGRAMAGFAIRRCYAGHACRSTQTRHALRFKPDHPIGAGQPKRIVCQCSNVSQA